MICFELVFGVKINAMECRADQLIEINANELLSREKSSANEYQQKAEENRMILAKENEYTIYERYKLEFDKKHSCNYQLTDFHAWMVAMQPMILL